MLNDPTVAALLILLGWQLASICSVFFKDRSARIPKRGYFLFLFLGGALGVSRVAVLWYLSYRNSTHTAYANLFWLHWLLLPEGRFIEMVPAGNYYSIPLMYAGLFLGSFLWTFPFVLWSIPRKHRQL